MHYLFCKTVIVDTCIYSIFYNKREFKGYVREKADIYIRISYGCISTSTLLSKKQIIK